MRTTRYTLLAAGLILLALPGAAPAAEATEQAEELIPITDPARLERMGFEPDATNVYMTQRVQRKLAMSPEERAALQEGMLADPEASPAGGVFGTSSWGYSRVMGTEFYPLQFDTSNHPSWRTGSGGRHCAAGPSGGTTYRATIHGLPHGADLRQVSVWLYDDSSSLDSTVRLYRVCQPDFGPGAQVNTLLDVVSTSGAAGHQYKTLGCIPSGGFPPTFCPIVAVLHETIDLESCVYLVQVGFEACSVDLGIVNARARWERQISPAPATATFDDVPPGNLFFQHIEALAASGITSGCDANSFCPNAPLTRGQMATFLAEALGLHWENVPQP